MQVGVHEQRHVESAIDEERVACLSTQLRQSSRLFDEEPNRSLGVAMLNGHARAQGQGGLDVLKQGGAGDPPIGDDDESRQRGRHYWISPSIGLDADP